MLKIRLKRTGKKGQPHYRVVVAQSTRKRSSISVEEIGYYNPRTKPSTFEVDKEKAKEWMKNGAQPTDTVSHFFVKLGIMKPVKKGSTLSKGRKPKKEAKE
ncbi:MAG TPA: 30S ribosomal protein S16 [Candidatus Dojkabacteria bacterium]|nr:30S ribosomal protein S16 [Candidatus Dojkabacteria bacterium]